MFLTTEIKQTILSHQQNAPEQEVCGFIIPEGSERVKWMSNHASNPADDFSFEPDLWGKIQASGPINAIYHTHWRDDQPAQLSSHDISNSKALGIPYLLYHSGFDQWDYFDPSALYPYPMNSRGELVQRGLSPKQVEFYQGWPWEYGRSDCYTIFRNYYRGMLGIELDDFPRGDEDELESPLWNVFEDSFEGQGFRRLEKDEPLQNQDVLIMTIRGKQAHHCAVMVDASKSHVLHSVGPGRLSSLDVYGGMWQEMTRFVIRHRSFE